MTTRQALLEVTTAALLDDGDSHKIPRGHSCTTHMHTHTGTQSSRVPRMGLGSPSKGFIAGLGRRKPCSHQCRDGGHRAEITQSLLSSTIIGLKFWSPAFGMRRRFLFLQLCFLHFCGKSPGARLSLGIRVTQRLRLECRCHCLLIVWPLVNYLTLTFSYPYLRNEDPGLGRWVSCWSSFYKV